MTATPGIHRDDTTSSTTEETAKVASVATDEAQHVASEVQDQVRRLVDETRVQARDQATTQRDRLVETLRTLGDDLHAMAARSDSSGLAADVTRRAADQARAISSSIDGREPSELLQDLRGFARRRPGLFLLGALTAGVVAGRLARGAASSSSGDATPSLADSDLTAENPALASPAATGGRADAGFDPGLPSVPAAGSAVPREDDLGLGDPVGAPTTGQPSPYQGGTL